MQTLVPQRRPARPAALEAALRAARAALDTAHPDLVTINDPQRGTATAAVLAAGAGLFDWRRTRFLVATGSHRFGPTEREPFAARLSAAGAADVLWHDARADDLAAVGGPDGWRAHPLLAAARTVLAIGSVEPHYFAGFTGAHKTLTIGCAAHGDIERNHAGAMDPACAPCRPERSPVHAGIVRMLNQLGEGRSLAAVNLLQAGEGVIDAAGGAPLASLDDLLPAATDAAVCRIPHPAEALVAEVDGALACSFYQAEKGIKNHEAAVRDGGTLVLAATCPDGIGQRAFAELLGEAPTYAEAVARVRRRGYRLGDHKAVRLRRLTDPTCRGVRVWVVSPGLPAAEAAVLGVRTATSIGAALAAAGVDPAAPGVFRVPDAANVCTLADSGLSWQPMRRQQPV